MVRGTNGIVWRAAVFLAAAALAGPGLLWPSSGRAASFMERDLRVLGRAAAFMLPPPAPDSVLAIAYVAGNAASRQDAEAIAALIGPGLRAGQLTLRPRLIEVGGLEAGGFQIVIAAAGANGPRLGAAARSARALCVTTEAEAVRTGHCALAISTEPRVEIILNHAVASATGVTFAAAFRMMIREL